MSANPEPLAAVLADYRADIPAMTSGELPHPTPEYLRIMLDRIEAAVKREMSKNRPNNGSKIGQFGNASSCAPMSLDEAIKHAEERADGSPCGQAHAQLAGWLRELRDRRTAPGNAAALRHALGIVYDWILKAGNVHGYPDTEQKRRQLYDMMTKALSAPPRNCDRFATTAAAAVAFRHARPDEAGEDFAYNFVAWLFAPAEGGVK